LRRLRARVATARALLRRADGEPTVRARRKLARAARVLGAFVATAERGMAHGRLDSGLGMRLVDLATDATNRLG
jgi:hypothetical protein